MSAAAWLPESAFGDPLVAGALAPALHTWSVRWFAHGAALDTVYCGPAVDAPPGRADGGVSVVALSGTGKRAIIERALGISLAEKILNASDHRLLDVFAARIVDDLLAALNDVLGKSGGVRVVVAFMAGGEAVLTVTMPRTGLAEAIRRSVKPSLPRPALTANLSAALQGLQVEAEGVLGSAECAWTEVRSLSVGDVLILERDLKAPVDLRIAGETQTLRRGKLGRDGDRVTIRING